MRKGPRQMATATRPHGKRGKRYMPDTAVRCEDCDRELPNSTNVVCLDCERKRDAEWDAHWAEMDAERDGMLDEFPMYDEDSPYHSNDNE